MHKNRKRFLSLLVAVAMVACMVAGVPAAEAEAVAQSRLTLDGQGYGECPVCKTVVKWTEFDGTQAYRGTSYTDEDGDEAWTGISEHMHLYLAKDVTYDGRTLGTNLLKIGDGGSACFHLNGKTLTATRANFWLMPRSTDSTSVLNIIAGPNGKINYTNTAIIQQNYGRINIYGGTYTPTGTSDFMKVVTRTVTLTDATVNGNLTQQSNYGLFALYGNTTAKKLIYTYGSYLARLVLDSSWSGSAVLDVRDSDWNDGVLDPDRFKYVGTAPVGTLMLSTGEKLGCNDGKLVLPELTLDDSGYGQCSFCHASVLWETFDGTKAYTVQNEHKHFCLQADIDSAAQLTLAVGGEVCFHLNGFTMMTGDTGFRVEAADAVLNILGTKGQMHQKEGHLIQLSAGTVNVLGGTYSSVGNVPFISAAGGTAVLSNAAVEAGLQAQDTAIITLQGSTCANKVNLDAGGKVKLASGWNGTATLDMDTTDLVGGKVPASKVSCTGTPAGTVKLASGKVLAYRDGVFTKPDDLSLDAEGNGLCPMCGQTVKWTALGPDGIASSNEAHSHVYLADNLLSTNPCELIEPQADEKVCLHLNGYDLTTGSIVHAAGGEVNIYGYGSNYTFTGEQAAGNVGIYAYNGGTLNIYGGTYSFAPAAGKESTKMLVVDRAVRIEDATVHTDVIMDSNNGRLTLAGDTVITKQIRFGSSSILRGVLEVDKSFSGSATVEYKSGLVSSNVFQALRGSATGDFTGTLKLSDGKRLINNGGNLKVGLVADPLSWKKLDAMPIANNAMTEQELRQLCLDFFRITLSFAWTPKANAYFQNKTTNPVKHYYTGTVYGGTPYISNTTGSVYTAMEYYDSITGTLNISGDAKQTIMNFSNQCSGSAFWAWNRVCTSIAYNGTSDTLTRSGCLRVGPYTYPDELWQFQSEGTNSTTRICQANGEQTMYESYALTKPADGIVTVSPVTGHNRMISTYPTVVRNADGTIDGQRSYLWYIDQDGEYNADTQPDGTAYTHIGVDSKFTFADMYNEGYIPFTFAELCGQKVVDKSVTTMSYTGQTVTAEQLKNATVSSNYSISDVTVTVKDVAGNPVYRKLTSANTIAPTKTLLLQTNVSWAVDEEALAAYTDGTHTVEVSVRIGTGEKPVVYSGWLCDSPVAKIAGSKTAWYATTEDAISDYSADDFAAGNYLRFSTGSNVTLTGGKYYIDAAGYDLAVTGTGTLYAFDGENADFEGFGKWTIAEGVEIIRDFLAPDGNRYLVITEDGVTGSHRLVLELAGITVNTEQAGLSYNAQYRCDAALAEKIEAYGIVASTQDMPGAQLGKGDARTELYDFSVDDNHAKLTDSSYVYGIFKDARPARENTWHGKTKIYANPYIQLDADGDGQADVFVGDTENVGKQAGNCWSLYDVLKEIDDNWATYADQHAAVNAFYNTWKDKGMRSYGFANIA